MSVISLIKKSHYISTRQLRGSLAKVLKSRDSYFVYEQGKFVPVSRLKKMLGY